MPARTSGRRAAAVGIAAALLALAGCGPKEEYAEVEGKVTLNGQSLSGVRVWFYPDDEGNEQRPYATATTDASGAYALTTAPGKRGRWWASTAWWSTGRCRSATPTGRRPRRRGRPSPSATRWPATRRSSSR